MDTLTFQQRIYELVKKIPKGKVTTYGQIALVLGEPRWARYVGWALHHNIDSHIPCHRVVNRKGRLAHNYAYGGWQKQRQKLLAEGVKFKDERHVDASLFKNLWSGSRGVL